MEFKINVFKRITYICIFFLKEIIKKLYFAI